VTSKVEFTTAQALVPGAAPTDADKRAWKREIESVWNAKWKIHRVDCERGQVCDCHADNGCCMFKVNIKCEWARGHSKVTLNDGANSSNWGSPHWWFAYTWWMKINGNLGNVRAHEFGHLLGLYDEYPEGACLELSGKRPFSNTRDGSIMNRGHLTHERHLRDFKQWFDKKAGGLLGKTELIRIP
jgi:hypothetical protein